MQPRPPAGPFSPLLEFLRSEGAGGAMLIAAAAVALAWANSRFGPHYEALLHWTPPLPARLQLHVWINDGLMVLFFLLVGLELRREITSGELATPEQLAAPTIAAVGGMVAPALIFMAFNWGQPEPMRGWAVPVATDIAFALAVANALGRRFPLSLKVFLTALAIIDDLGAILIIAFFYSKGMNFYALGGAALVLAALYGLNRAGVRAIWPYLLGGVALWALVLQSGVHATLAGVALAMVIPIDARDNEPDAPAMRLEHTLHPWVSYLVLPVFGLANAGLSFDVLPPGAWTSTLTIGAFLGLVVGKQVGVFGATFAAVRLGVARLPEGVTMMQLYGAAALCGIGFTMSLFIGELAFRDGPLGDVVTLAVFAASIVSAAIGLVVLGFCASAPALPGD